jgi:hypothetical protein
MAESKSERKLLQLVLLLVLVVVVVLLLRITESSGVTGLCAIGRDIQSISIKCKMDKRL